jgi:hypothetical protein
MALPKEAENVRVTEDIRFERTGQTTPVKVLTFTVGEHGPFRLEIPRSEYSAEVAERMVSREITSLRSLGVIK